MALGYKTRRRLSLLVLLVGMPLYVVVAVTVVNLFDRPPFWLELLVYVGLGFLWILPMKPIFIGVGQPDPEQKPDAVSQRGDTPPR
ncbi:uncharacterized protein DUF2842 [Cereibacter ovatus]|uniref:Uncharacterized protein DUF2842 n=1 Tax=Cereibacter ovatus TaxID=439529 RepID=A0A285CYW3_9RHOB|nr:DUF2842 domain-containing protein [Cereibacter ovatus]SNX72719.1 uncharacterized protein DUF2842 [Cereibacter ovatus]